MFARTFRSGVIVPIVTLLAIARGSPTVADGNRCNNGPVQCCDQLFHSSDPSVLGLLGILGIAKGDIVGDIGLACTPINVLGIGKGGGCEQQAVCCDNVVQDGVINFGCSPVSLNL